METAQLLNISMSSGDLPPTCTARPRHEGHPAQIDQRVHRFCAPDGSLAGLCKRSIAPASLTARRSAGDLISQFAGGQGKCAAGG